MTQKYAILMDAGFVRRKLGTKNSPLDIEKIRLLCEKIKGSEHLKNCILHRIYYYDAEPSDKIIDNKPLTESKTEQSQIDLSKTLTYKLNKPLLEDLKKEPYFALRIGHTGLNGWEVNPKILSKKNTRNKDSITITAENIKPDIKQKGVDMRIGLDMASLSLKNHVDIIVIVTGDSDFIPAFKFARKEGKQIILYTLNHGIKGDLREHCDICNEETLD